jgi:hypothetical protein
MKKRKNIFAFNDVQELGKSTADVGPNTGIIMQPSTEGAVTIPGTKCEHGVYIPATSADPNRALYCSLCHPYEINIKGEADPEPITR